MSQDVDTLILSGASLIASPLINLPTNVHGFQVINEQAKQFVNVKKSMISRLI